jgi:hypothetical protein
LQRGVRPLAGIAQNCYKQNITIAKFRIVHPPFLSFFHLCLQLLKPTPDAYSVCWLLPQMARLRDLPEILDG